ncbi:type II toxin-antitoxin system YafQ family toxin [Selenomonas sp.]|uniref:type II toxin-antitoxin system YafQ family toxin n=1 Tax=Selenomonas sp. TaxID=2053611 RepID=UPI0025FC190F|nr:type II toxin-antitoxin system YafQ family toxin [Selenomonas sp.]MCI6285074.1 type II toxin-antitoxin system YafQ family toxin [Selenomonas sp.]
MLKVRYSSQFKRDFKRIKKRGLPLQKLKDILDALAKEEALPPRCHDHQLTGDQKEFRECHIQPDWLLIYRVQKEELVLVAQRTGTHSDLFQN